jgi:putative DNA primase/helicase
MVHLTDGQEIPLSRIRSVAAVDHKGRLMGAWTVRDHGLDGRGKGGQQRGTSGREDSLDTVVQLAKPTGVDAREGCHFELSFEKNRSVTGDAVAPLDVRLVTVNEGLQWDWKALEVSMLDRARHLVADGVEGPTALSEELGINKGYASRILKKLREEKP